MTEGLAKMSRYVAAGSNCDGMCLAARPFNEAELRPAQIHQDLRRGLARRKTSALRIQEVRAGLESARLPRPTRLKVFDRVTRVKRRDSGAR